MHVTRGGEARVSMTRAPYGAEGIVQRGSRVGVGIDRTAAADLCPDAQTGTTRCCARGTREVWVGH